MVSRYNGERHDYGASATFSIASFDLAFDGLHLTVTVAGGAQVVWDGFTGVQISLSGQVGYVELLVHLKTNVFILV